jgi:hypothetical protein
MWKEREGHYLVYVPEDGSLPVIGDLQAEGLYVFPDGRSPVECAAIDLLPGEHVRVTVHIPASKSTTNRSTTGLAGSSIFNFLRI